MRHYHVKQDEEKNFWISEKHRFATIAELVQYHKSNGGGVCYVGRGIVDESSVHMSVCVRTCGCVYVRTCKHTVVIKSTVACTTHLACL